MQKHFTTLQNTQRHGNNNTHTTLLMAVNSLIYSFAFERILLIFADNGMQRKWN